MMNIKSTWIIYAAITSMLASCNAEPELYLIPADFSGKVTIIFDQNEQKMQYHDERNQKIIYIAPKGTPIKYENGRRVYDIPKTGLLLTQFKSNPGFIDTRYFLVNNKGKRTQLKIFTFAHYKKDSAGYVVDNKNLKGIFAEGTSIYFGDMHVRAIEFVVSDYNHLDSFYTKNYLNEFHEMIKASIVKRLQ